jgi:hypothetical protein
MADEIQEHEDIIHELADKHFESMRAFDRLTGIIFAGKVGEDRLTEGLDGLVDYIYKARQDSFKLGRNK